MERFENEYGTLTALALFFGRKNTYLRQSKCTQNWLTKYSIDDGTRHSVHNHRASDPASEQFSNGRKVSCLPY